MKNVKPLKLLCLAVLALNSACSTTTNSASSTHASASTPPASVSPAPAPAQPDSAALQGTWKGKEIGGQVEGDVYLIIKGKELEYRGADPGEWYKGTFTVREDKQPRQLIGEVQDCPAPKYVGKQCLAIYRIDGDRLTITGNEPGNPEFPSALDSADSRQFVLQKQ